MTCLCFAFDGLRASSPFAQHKFFANVKTNFDEQICLEFNKCKTCITEKEFRIIFI